MSKIEQTLSIIKPDAVGKNVIGKIITRFEENGLYLVAGKLLHLTDELASDFMLIMKENHFLIL